MFMIHRLKSQDVLSAPKSPMPILSLEDRLARMPKQKTVKTPVVNSEYWSGYYDAW